MSRIERSWNATRRIARTTTRAASATSRIVADGTADLAGRISGQHRHLERSEHLNEELGAALDRLEVSILELKNENATLRARIAELEATQHGDDRPR